MLQRLVWAWLGQAPLPVGVLQVLAQALLPLLVAAQRDVGKGYISIGLAVACNTNR